MTNLRDIAVSLLPKIKELDDAYYKTQTDPDGLIDDFNTLVAQTAHEAGVGEFDLHLEIETLEEGIKNGQEIHRR